jgi:hypothetical protein
MPNPQLKTGAVSHERVPEYAAEDPLEAHVPSAVVASVLPLT